MRPVLFLLALLALPTAAAAPSAPQSLPSLLNQLSHAGSPEDAKPIEEKIGGIFLQSGSPSVDLLMSRGTAALAAGDTGTAKQLFEAVTDVAPNYAEGWHARANLQRTLKDDSGAMVSLEHVILLNPRQFAAMFELGNLLEEYGNKDGALKIYRKALALDPQLEGVQKHVDALTRDVEGQGI
ncbi:MAG TPA: tetratricopeptide repeat protein [Rhizomicrobium sp.]